MPTVTFSKRPSGSRYKKRGKTFTADINRSLNKLGHMTEYIDIPHGGGQAIMIKKNNFLIGGSDPRKDGIALGF